MNQTAKDAAGLIENLKFEMFEGSAWITLRGGDVEIVIAALEMLRGVADGTHVIRPIEPTKGIAYAGAKVWDNEPDDYQIECAKDTYRAMITENE